MKTLLLPYLDTNGALTPIVVDAMETGGATSDYNPHNREEIILTFEDDGQFDHFSTLLKLAASNPNDVQSIADAPAAVVEPVVDPTPAPDAAE